MNLEQIETLAKKRISEAKSDYDMRLKFPDEYAMNLAYSRRTKGAGAAAWAPNYFYPTTASTIRTYHPRLIDGLIGPDGTNFFDLEADGEYDESQKDADGNVLKIPLDISAKIIIAIQNKHFADNGMFYDTQSQIEHNCLVFGRGYSITGWEDSTEEFSYFKPVNGKLEKITITKRINRPTRYSPSPTDIWPDPAAKNWADKTYVVERQTLRLSRLKSMVNRWNQKERFNNVVKMVEDAIIADYNANRQKTDTLIATVPGSIDPIQTIFNVYAKGEITTMWMNYCIKYVGGETGAPFAHGNIPVYAYQFEQDFYRYAPKGLPLILSDINEMQNTALNLTFMSWMIQVLPIFKQRRTTFVDTQDKTWEPGKVMMVDDMKDFEEMIKSNTNVESHNLLEMFAGMANQASGSMDYMNAPTGVAAVNKTFGGAKLIKQEANQAMARVIKNQKETALVPELQDLLMNYDQFLDESTVKELLGEKRAKELNYTENFKIAWNAKWKYKITGNISLMDKQTKLENIETATQALKGLYDIAISGAPINPKPVVEQILDTLDVPKEILDFTPPPPPPGAAVPGGPAAPAQAGPAAPAPATPKPAPVNGLTPEQIGKIPAIAQALGTTPDLIMADLQKGIIPNFAALEHLMSNPAAMAKFKASLRAAPAPVAVAPR